MYLRDLKLRHVRLFEQTELSFANDDGSPRMFTVVLAENGHAKTTLLQSIALAAVGVSGANKLFGDASALVDRRSQWSSDHEESCHIGALFTFSEARHAERVYPTLPDARERARPPVASSTVMVSRAWRSFDGVSNFLSDGSHEFSRDGVVEAVRAKDLPHWFVVGYGVSRALPDVTQPPANPGNRSVERLASLFRPTPLIATGFLDVLTRAYGAETANDYARALREVLLGTDEAPGVLPREGALRIEGLELRGQGGPRGTSDLLEAERVVVRVGGGDVKLPTVWLSAGYQSTIAWIADLIGQHALDVGRVVPPSEMEGLVLIDEIDQHLHPRWQSTLVPALKRAFPRLQFVVTTHSPMVLPELAPGEVLRLRADARGSVSGERTDDDPRLLTAAQLYREFFGVEGPLSPVGERFRRYGLLAGVTARTDDEEREVQDLYTSLRRDAVAVEPPLPRDEAATETST